MDGSAEDASDDNPDEAAGSVHGTQNGPEDRAETGNVEELDHEHFPGGHLYIIHAVGMSYGRGLAIGVGAESLLDEFAIDEIAENQQGQGDKKGYHRICCRSEESTRFSLKALSSSDTLTQLYNVAQFYDQTGKLNLATYCYYQYIKYCPTGEYIESAKKRFIKLKPITQAVYFEIPKESVRKYPKDTMIFCENQEGREMFIIQQGQVKISKVVKNQELIFAVLKKGDFFGEMALLENKPRSASAIAHDDCVLMSVNAENFNQLVTTQPQLVARLTTTLADRLWSMYRQIANTKILDPVCKIFDMLALQVEKEKLVENGNKSYQFELTMQDLMNMCSIPQMEQRPVALKIKQSTMIKINEGKLFVTDCKELVSMASKFRKQKN